MKTDRKYLKEGASRLEIMNSNKALYSRLEKALNNLPDGLKKYVIKYFGLPWCKNNNWLGGMSDSASNKAIYKILSLGDYNEDEIMDEMDNFISCFTPDKSNKSEDEKLKLYLNEDLNKKLTEDLFDKPRDIADSICKYLDSKNFYNYELIDYDSYPMDTSRITLEVDGDWKHDHLRFKDLVYDWSFDNNKSIYKIDSELVRDDGSDNYASNYFIYVTENEDDLNSLKSMSKLFSEEYEDDVDNWQYLDTDYDYKPQKDYFIPELRDEMEVIPGELSRRFKKYLNKEEESLSEGLDPWYGKYVPMKMGGSKGEPRKVYFYFDSTDFEEAEEEFFDIIPEPYVKAKLYGRASESSLVKDGFESINESLNEASYGGAFDIEDDMYFTKEELVEFAGDVAEEFSKMTGHLNCDVDNVYMENNPLALNVDIYDPEDGISHSAYTRIDMRKIRKPSDIYRYMDRILKQLEDSFHEYHENDFEED